jgi:hypothetical protein
MQSREREAALCRPRAGGDPAFQSIVSGNGEFIVERQAGPVGSIRARYDLLALFFRHAIEAILHVLHLAA